MTAGLSEWPLDTNGNYAIPVPLLSPDHTGATRHSEALMESGRVRRRRMQLELQEFLKASWNFTDEEFSTFVAFFEQTIDNGALSFLLKTFEDSPTKPGELAEVWWELAFVNEYQFSRSDGVVSVSGTLEVLDKELFDALPDIVFGYFHDEGNLDTNLIVESSPSACRENVSVILDGLVEGNLYVLEIAAFVDGPWDHYIFFALLTTEERTTRHKRVSMSNWFGGTQPFFRVKLYRDFNSLLIDGVMTKAGSPLGPAVVPPDLTVANISEISTSAQLTIASAGDNNLIQGVRSLDTYRTSNGFVIPYSFLEDPMVFTSRMYRPFIRKYITRQFAWNGHWGTLSAETTQNTPVTITGPAGATLKWSRDGTVPALTDPAPAAIGGVANNAFVGDDKFGGIIMARCFSGTCSSPLVMVCVDKLMYERPTLTTAGLNNTVAGSCDLPTTDVVTGLPIESGASCNINWGGICPFESHILGFLLSVLAPAGSRPGTLHGPLLRFREKTVAASTYIGWPIHAVGASRYDFVSSAWNSPGDPVYDGFFNGWQIAPRNHNWGLIFQNNNPLFIGMVLVDFQASLAGAVGTQGQSDRASWAFERDGAIIGFLSVVPIPDDICNVGQEYFMYADRFDIMRTPLYYNEPRDLHWLGVGLDLSTPITNLPFDPTLVNPPTTPYDRFETYYDGDATTASMDYRTGVDWDAAWTVRDGALGTYGWDFFDYADGAIPTYTTHVAGDGYVYYNAGEAWELGATVEWAFTTPEPATNYIDDFESYTDGPAPFNMTAGTGWYAESNFTGWRMDNDLIGGVDYFETYADGTFVGSNTGTNFVANENWRAT